MAQPDAVDAATCSDDGYTVVFVNGVSDTLEQAKADEKDLEFALGPQENGQPITVKLEYNPEHLAGLGDVIEAASQMLLAPLSDYDLHTALRAMAVDVTTRKLLLVGHSQGALYANSIYDYVTSHGEPARAVAVYALATPGSYVAGGGGYATSKQDAVIYFTTLAADKSGAPLPLPPNVSIMGSADPNDLLKTHALATYLDGAGDTVVPGIKSELSGLAAGGYSKADCFAPPAVTGSDRLQGALFTVADPAALAVRAGAIDTYRGGEIVAAAAASAVKFGFAAAGSALSVASDFFPNPFVNPAAPENTSKNFNIVKKLYGSSLTPADIDALTSSQGAAVATALIPHTPAAQIAATTSATSSAATSTPPVPPVMAATTTAGVHAAPAPRTTGSTAVFGGGDDAIQGQSQTSTSSSSSLPPPDTTPTSTPPVLFTATSTPPALTVPECAYSLNAQTCLLPMTAVTLDWTPVEGAVSYEVTQNGTQVKTVTGTSTTLTLEDQAAAALAITALDASSTALTSATKSVVAFTQPVIINEVGWAGTRVSSGDQWLELKNRTTYAIDASRLVLLAEDGGTQYIPLSGTIPAFTAAAYPFSGFYLVERDAPVLGSVHHNAVPSFDPLASSGEELALVAQGIATTTLDRTPPLSACSSWCAGAALADIGASIEEVVSQNTLSMERVNATTSGALASNWASNDTYTKSGGDSQNGILYGTPGRENSLHQPEAGWYCNPDTLSIQSGDTYHPASGNCTYLARFISYPSAGAGALFKGVVGSSTLVSPGHVAHYLGRPGQSGQVTGDTISGAAVGDQFFVALWEPRVLTFPDPGDSESFVSYFTTGHPLVADPITGALSTTSATTPPHTNYRVIPFTYGPQ